MGGGVREKGRGDGLEIIRGMGKWCVCVGVLGQIRAL